MKHVRKKGWPKEVPSFPRSQAPPRGWFCDIPIPHCIPWSLVKRIYPDKKQNKTKESKFFWSRENKRRDFLAKDLMIRSRTVSKDPFNVLLKVSSLPFPFIYFILCVQKSISSSHYFKKMKVEPKNNFLLFFISLNWWQRQKKKKKKLPPCFIPTNKEKAQDWLLNSSRCLGKTIVTNNLSCPLFKKPAWQDRSPKTN